MFAKMVLVLVVSVLGGCSAGGSLKLNDTYPGGVTVKESEFDGMAQVEMKPGYVYRKSNADDGGILRFGARWSSRTANSYVLVAQVDFPHWFSKDGMLKLRVDGVEYLLPPVNAGTAGAPVQDVVLHSDAYLGTAVRSNVVRKDYQVDADFLLELADSNEVIGRLSTTRGFIDFSAKSSSVNYNNPLTQQQLFILQLKPFLSKVNQFNTQVSIAQ